MLISDKLIMGGRVLMPISPRQAGKLNKIDLKPTTNLACNKPMEFNYRTIPQSGRNEVIK